MRIIVFGANRKGVQNALKLMLDKNIEVVGCVLEEETPNELYDLCCMNNISVYHMEEFTKMVDDGTAPQCEYAIAYLYHKIITEEVISYYKGNIINVHPAPTQVHRGVGNFCYCLLNNYKEWGVTAHYLISEVDEGDIIMQHFYSVEGIETAMELEKKQQEENLVLIDKLLTLLCSGNKIPREKLDVTKGEYYSHKKLNKDKEIQLTDKKEEVDKKIKSLWFPPYSGACIEIDGAKYTLVNEEILKEIADLYRSRGE